MTDVSYLADQFLAFKVSSEGRDIIRYLKDHSRSIKIGYIEPDAKTNMGWFYGFGKMGFHKWEDLNSNPDTAERGNIRVLFPHYEPLTPGQFASLILQKEGSEATYEWVVGVIQERYAEFRRQDERERTEREEARKRKKRNVIVGLATFAAIALIILANVPHPHG